MIPANKGKSKADKDIKIFLRTNGVHADLVLPFQNQLEDWSGSFPAGDFVTQKRTEWIAFGWGDKGFYLDTPTWSDLKASTAIKALFMPSPTAMHVTLYDFTPSINERTREIWISNEQYQELVSYIKSSFEKDPNYLKIDTEGYPGHNDAFYEAKGSYTLFLTCNEWANKGLKQIGLQTALWSPFDWGMLKLFP